MGIGQDNSYESVLKGWYAEKTEMLQKYSQPRSTEVSFWLNRGTPTRSTRVHISGLIQQILENHRSIQIEQETRLSAELKAYKEKTSPKEGLSVTMSRKNVQDVKNQILNLQEKISAIDELKRILERAIIQMRKVVLELEKRNTNA